MLLLLPISIVAQCFSFAGANVEADTSDPALMTGYALTEAHQADDAKCLDGTPGLYYFRYHLTAGKSPG